MSQNKMFDEFNNQYSVGCVEPTHANLEKALSLVLDEVKEAYEELYGFVSIDIETRNPKEVNIPAIAKEFEDIRYMPGERMRHFGWDVDAIEGETHGSNMSKKVLPETKAHELSTAAKRYPHVYAEKSTVGDFYVLRCGKTGKVVKPSTYTPAVITDEMISL